MKATYKPLIGQSLRPLYSSALAVPKEKIQKIEMGCMDPDNENEVGAVIYYTSIDRNVKNRAIAIITADEEEEMRQKLPEYFA